MMMHIRISVPATALKISNFSSSSSSLEEPYVPPISVFLQYPLGLQVTSPHVLFCFCTVNLELLTCTYSLYRESLYL